MADAIAVLKKSGAIVVDPAEVPSFVTKDAKVVEAYLGSGAAARLAAREASHG